MARCYHCHEAVPAGANWQLELHGQSREFCCPGCRAVAELIATTGLERFYEFRSAPGQRVREDAARGDGWAVCDRPEVERRLVRAAADGTSELRFRIDGINCAACVWLIDRGLTRLDGIRDVSVNPVTREAQVRFDPERVRVGAILEATEHFGFTPRLALSGSVEAATNPERDALKRLAVAGLGFAQVMMFSAALYLGAFKSMDQGFTSFLTLVSMLVATPVVLYAGAPIFRAAIRDLMRGRLGMDVPVSLAIAIALFASFFNTFRGAGDTWFDSATMFVFFLTLGRFLETRARHKAGSHVAALAELKPLSALRRTDGGVERVGTIELEPGDVVIVGPGEALPADGVLVSAAATVDESLLSGESLGRRRVCGEPLLGGSLNVASQPLELRVTAASGDGYVEQVGSLLNRAMADRPEFLRLADRWAGVFVATVLLVTALAGGVWLYVAPERSLQVVLSMLVIACPCALSLAAPTAYAVALGRLARFGLLLGSARVFERLGAISVWLFDKTGTLTMGRLGVVQVDALGAMDPAACLEIAAALETGIEHPVARALAGRASVPPAAAVELVPGFGVTGSVAGRSYRLGSARFVGLADEDDSAQRVYLAEAEAEAEGEGEAKAATAAAAAAGADAGRVLARIVLEDRIRPHAREAVAQLGDTAAIELVSGDAAGPVRAVANALGIGAWRAQQTPADKLAIVQVHQRSGGVVAAVGDGVNDAPLLAQADVSIAMLEGSRLAQAGADVVFTGADLRVLARLPALARATRAVVRQNLTWASLYNLTALPLAATGIVEPWMAALGMSLSSLFVVGNALRLNRVLDDRVVDPAAEFAAPPLAGGAGQ